jgi:hypothetical protein
MSLGSNLVSVFIMKIQNMVIPFILLPYVYKYHNDYVADYAWLWGSYLLYNTIIDFGASVLGSYIVARNIFSFDFIRMLLVLRLILWSGIALMLALGESLYGSFLAVILIFSVFNTSFFYQGRLANTVLLKQEIATKIPYVLFVVISSQLMSLPMAVLVGLLGIGFTKVLMNRRLLRVFISRGRAFHGRGQVKSLFWFAGARTSSVAAAEGTQVFITAFSESVKADFPMVQLVYNISQNIGTVVSQVLTPHWSNKRPSELRHAVMRILIVYLFVFLFYALLWYVLNYSNWLNMNVFSFRLYSQELLFFLVAGFISNLNVILGFPAHGLFQILDKANFGVIVGGVLYIIGISALSMNIYDLSLALVVFELTVLLLRLFTLFVYGICSIK